MRDLVLRLNTDAQVPEMTHREIAEAAGDEAYARSMLAFEDRERAMREGDRERDRVLAALRVGGGCWLLAGSDGPAALGFPGNLADTGRADPVLRGYGGCRNAGGDKISDLGVPGCRRLPGGGYGGGYGRALPGGVLGA